jgi:hypothetical protein
MQVDRLFDWDPRKDAPIQESLANQKDYVQSEFDKRLKASILALNEQVNELCGNQKAQTAFLVLCKVSSSWV